jgi:hypothetical protein
MPVCIISIPLLLYTKGAKFLFFLDKQIYFDSQKQLKISSRFPPTEPTLSGTIVRCLIELESGKATIIGEFKIGD